MSKSIPASRFVSVQPGVLQAGGNALSMNTVFVDTDSSIPIGTVQNFANQAAVAAWFGAESTEAALATVYFGGFIGATALPSAMWFTQFNEAAVAAYLRSGSLAAVSLTTLQGYSGTIDLEVNGIEVSSAAIDLSSATSFSNAAALIQAGLQTAGNVWSGTLTTVLDSTSVDIISTTTGELHIGDIIVDAGAFIPVAATIVSFGTYTTESGVGTVIISSEATGAEAAAAATVTILPTVTYDSLRAGFVISSPTTGVASTIAYPTDTSLSPDIFLTLATGAVLSQGADPATPAGTMDNVVNQTQNWAAFMTTFEPDLSVKLEFAAWVNSEDEDYAYVCFDSDVTPEAGNDPTCFAQQVADYNGVISVWNPSGLIAAFICSIIGSIDFTATDGRTVFAYRSQAGLIPDITDLTTYNNLVANGYNCYANVATRTQQFQWLQPGQISGQWDWIDPYINQIYWNSQFQNDYATFLSQNKSVPYTQLGYTATENALASDIKAMGDFGAWVSGVTLSSQQVQEVNAAAGLSIASILQTQGWYLQVTDPGPDARQARTSPDITFWYTDGGSIQQIQMASNDVE